MRVIPPDHRLSDAPGATGSPTIGKYRIIETIGQGAMGVVYKARDPEIGRDVAIKLLRSMKSSHPQDAADAFKRFRLEARSAGNLRHPNIITIYEANQESDRPYIVMEYIRGEGLDQILARERRLAPERALEIFRQIAAGLDHAHSKGVVHRDIKPSNILIEGASKVLILDFGVASMSKRLAGAVPLPSDDPEIIVGTPAYMSPEQIRNEDLDGRSDLFSFAALAFEALTGKIPFLGDTATGLMRNIVAGKRRPLGQVAPDLPVALEFEFDRAFSIDREKRFATALEFSEALMKAFGMSIHETLRRTDSEKPISLCAKHREHSFESSQSGAQTSPRAQTTTPTAETLWREGSRRVSAEDPFGPRTAPPPQAPKPGAMFQGGTPPVIRLPNVAPSKRSRFGSRLAAEKTALFIVGGLMTPISFCLAFFLLSGSEPESLAVAATTTLTAEIERPAELESELVVPRTEDAPQSLSVPEMSNRQLLGVIVRASAPEQKLLEAITLAAERRLTEFVDASVAPLKHSSASIRYAVIKLLGNTGDRRIVPHLVLSLEDSEERVRVAAARSLAELGDRRALGFLSARYFAESSTEAQSALKRSIEQLSGLPLNEGNLLHHIKSQSSGLRPQS
jgi:serine/threonine protein kinase